MRNNEVSQCVLFRSRMNRAMEMSFCKFSQQVAVMYNYSGSKEVLYLRCFYSIIGASISDALYQQVKVICKFRHQICH